MDLSAVDLFCGAGGLTAGFEKAGLRVNAGIDIEAQCEFAYEENNSAEFLEADLQELSAREVEELFPDGCAKVLAGCAPCQPFSPLRHGEDTESSEEWSLLREFERFVREIEPEYLVMENVTGIRDESVYSEFVDTLFRLGYRVDVDNVDCPDYGVPQTRKRAVLIASNIGKISLPEATRSKDDPTTVREAIGDGKFPEIESGEVCDDDRLHQSRTLSDTNLRRIRQSRPGGTWREWDEELILDCHKKESGSTYDSVYGRMEWDDPGPTITTQFHNYGSGRFGHPEQDRAISLREGATLQTFPEDYSFVPEDQKIEFEKVSPMIGNAVPVALAEALAHEIKNHYTEVRNVQSH